MLKKFLSGLLISAALIGFTGCDDDEEVGIDVPDTYEFTRDGQSTVSYQGQIDRLNMLSEIKDYLKEGDAGEEIDASVLLDMYANENSPFSSATLNNSTKELKDKTFTGEASFYEALFASAEAASISGADASEGVAGLIERTPGSGRTILVNEKGWEYTQLIEKGLMGSVFYHQIFNVYLSDAKIGDDVENTALSEGKNYTPMEHHWDEAFGYWGVPVDFPGGDPVLEDSEDRFWAAYTFDRDVFLNVNEPLMNAYITGRTAIVNKDYDVKDAQRDIIYDLHELVTAATAVHYINSALDDIVTGDTGNFFHYLSEAYTFVKAVSYSPRAKLSQQEINTILNSNFGTDADFWTANEEGLRTAKATIVNAYPEMAGLGDSL